MLLFSIYYFLHMGNGESCCLVALMNNIKHFRRKKLRVEAYSFLQYIVLDPFWRLQWCGNTGTPSTIFCFWSKISPKHLIRGHFLQPRSIMRTVRPLEQLALQDLPDVLWSVEHSGHLGWMPGFLMWSGKAIGIWVLEALGGAWSLSS